MELPRSNLFISGQVPLSELAHCDQSFTVDGTFGHSVGEHGPSVEPIELVDRAVLQVLPERKCVEQQLLIVGCLDRINDHRVEDPTSVNDAVLLENAQSLGASLQLLCRGHGTTCEFTEARGQHLALTDGIQYAQQLRGVS